MLSLFSVSAAIDAGQIPLLVNQIRSDIHLSDVQISFILGFGSTMVTSIMLIPAGHLTDRFSRRILMAVSALAWSCAAALAGFASGFWSLFAARAGVAAAESPLYPTAHSMLRDAFPPRNRGMPFGVFWAAQAVGTSVSLFAGGVLLSLADAGRFHGWPLIGHFRSWQIVLAVPGFCTLPLTLLMLTVKEPARSVHPQGEETVTFRQFAKFLFGNWSLFWPSLAYSVCWGLQYYGVLSWQPTALARGWGIPTAELAKVTGVIGVPMSLAGLLVGGWLVDQLSRRGTGDGAIKVCLIFSLCAAVLQLMVYYVGSPVLIFACICATTFFNGTINSAYYVAVSYVTPGRLMGRMISLQFIVLYVPYSVSPVIIALLAQGAFGKMGALGIVPAIKTVLWVFSIGYCLLLALWARRVGHFCKSNAEGAI